MTSAANATKAYIVRIGASPADEDVFDYLALRPGALMAVEAINADDALERAVKIARQNGIDQALKQELYDRFGFAPVLYYEIVSEV